MDYKDTLHLPQTSFDMRANLVNKQEGFLAKWDEMDLYKKMLELHEGKPLYMLHDGPPYANGHIHIGHAFNKILKDFVIRSRFKLGYQVPFRPGWDTHGLPTENAVTKAGVNRKEISVVAFREACQKFAQEQVYQQMADMKRLGTVADYDDPYITYQPEFEAIQTELFAEMVAKGMIYQGLKPVYWSPSSESALAEAEIEYHDKKDPSIFVKFAVKDGKGILDTDTSFVIWTTTPWTIPANLAISVHPRFEYVLVNTAKGKLIVLKELLEKLMEEFGLEEYEVLNTYKGQEFEYMTTQHPLVERDSLIILGEHVGNDAGTGCVHTAPGFGMDDYIVGQKYGLEPYCNVNAYGKFDETSSDYLVGLTTEQGNKVVTQKLDEMGALLKLVFITHSYPHDWRTKKPVIYRATKQWFASIDSIREQLLSEIEKVEFKPSWGKQRMHNMIKDRGDWCISRQRAWGLPIPIFYAQDETPILDPVLIKHVSKLFGEHGSNIWFEWDTKDLLPEGYTHPQSPDGVFTQEKDILDVWFDSGSSHTAALASRGYNLPVDLYLEGSDQYRGWFNSSLVIATAVFGHAPYKQVVSAGFVLDDKDEKFSKSKGNALSPNALVDRLGAEIVRMWVASVDYTSDVRISEDTLKQVSENYRKIRNTLRFMHGNSSDLKREDWVDAKDMAVTERYVLSRVNKVVKKSLRAYENYNFSEVLSEVTKLLTNVMSSYYLDYTKDILYILKEDHPRRRQVQTVLAQSLEALIHVLSPIMAFTMEELNQIVHPEQESVHLEPFVTRIEVECSEEEEAKFATLLKLREAVYKALEDARATKLIGNSLKAKVLLNVDPSLKALCDEVFGEDLKQWFIVSQLEFTTETLPEVLGYQVKVEVAQGYECERCWNVVEHEHDGLCSRCQQQL